MDTRPIGFLDSGSGGLSVWQSVTAALPHENTVYIGDHANLPYGGKPRAVIRARAMALTRFLIGQHAKMVVVACNTATVAGIDAYRAAFPDVPIIGVVPVVKTAAARTKTGAIAVLSTAYTAKSAYQKRLIAEYGRGLRVVNAGSSTLVPLIEQGVTDSPAIRAAVARLYAPARRAGCDVVALGCTHYPFIADAVQAVVGPRVAVIDSGDAVARQAMRILAANNSAAPVGNTATHRFYTTGDTQPVGRTMSALLGRSVVVSHARIPYNGACHGA